MIPIGDERRSGIFAVGTWLIVAANVYVFWLELTAPRVETFINAYALIPYNLTHAVQLPPPALHPFWLTLVTAMFLHGSILHIAFNMLFLVVFGPRSSGIWERCVSSSHTFCAESPAELRKCSSIPTVTFPSLVHRERLPAFWVRIS